MLSVPFSFFYYEIQSGGIRIDGEDIRSMNVQDLRGRMGMVLQDTWRFFGVLALIIHADR